MYVDDWAPLSSDEEMQALDEALAACPSSPAACPSAAAKSAACPSGEPSVSPTRPKEVRRHAPAIKRKIGKKLSMPRPAKPAPKRKLMRRPTEGKPASEEVASMICVWGGVVKHPVPVWPLHREGGVFWLQLSEHSHWLRRACDQKGRTHYKDWWLAPNPRDKCNLRVRNMTSMFVRVCAKL